MSSARPEDQGTRLSRTAIHDQIIGDERPDARYADKLSNHSKAAYVREVMGFPASAFDLDLPFPIEEWMASDDNSLICAGLYLSDLRVQFYSRALLNDPALLSALWCKHAEAEYWSYRFNYMVYRRMNAVLLDDLRGLN